MNPEVNPNNLTPLDANGLPITYTQSDRGVLFYAATKTAATFGVGASASVATIVLVNPAVSANNLILRSAQIVLSAAPVAAVSLFYAKNIGADPSGTSQAGVNTGPLAALKSPIAAVGVPYSAATLSASPAIIRWWQSVLAAAALIQSVYSDDGLDGYIILEPGSQLTVQATAACNGNISLVWEEFKRW